MKYINLFLAFAFLSIVSVSAQSLTLDECLRQARENYPLIRQYGLTEAVRDFTLDNAQKGWLPQISLTAAAYGFTDILERNERFSAMGMDMKNYLAHMGVSVQQTVYDGGRIRASGHLAQAQAEAEQRQLEVSLYTVNERVQQLFFGTLLLESQIEQCRLLEADLGLSAQTITSMMNHGTANQSDCDAVRVEQVKAVQKRESLESVHRSYLSLLGVFVGKELGDSTRLVRPHGDVAVSVAACGLQRPEVADFAARNRLLEAQIAQINASLRPTIGFFGGAAFHNKLMSMSHKANLAAGVTLSWDISAFYTRKNSLSLIRLRQQQNEVLCSTFLFRNRVENEQTNGNILSLQRQISHDSEIVSLLQRIREKSELKVEQGLQSVNELLRDVNAVSVARQQQSVHEIQLLKEMYGKKLLNNE